MQLHNYNWQQRYKEKIISLVIILIICIACIWYLYDCTCHAEWYNDHVFQPWQIIRNNILKRVPISVGDIIYMIWGFSLLVLIVKWIFYLLGVREYGARLLFSFLKSIVTLGGVYLVFLIGWGGNYYKESLEQFWHLNKNGWSKSELAVFDTYLVTKLNETAPYYRKESFKMICNKAVQFYAAETDCSGGGKGLHIKRSLFGNMLKYMGVQGYYNPFTGEGQVNKNELHFVLPFLTAHELAHQAGVGAEDDANLLAYTVAINSKDTSFMYSAYFSLWLYTHMQLKMRDSVSARDIKKGLNPISLGHLDELRNDRRKYRSKFGVYTGDMYDKYLKLNQQEDGIESYDKVTVSAWAWERQRMNYRDSKVYIP